MEPTPTRRPRALHGLAVWAAAFAVLFALNILIPLLVGTGNWLVLLLLAVPLAYAAIRTMGAHQ